jgi:hypothetical protein
MQSLRRADCLTRLADGVNRRVGPAAIDEGPGGSRVGHPSGPPCCVHCHGFDFHTLPFP